jgi:pimeloyl-ACP methyl ester carboxylesterase
MNRVMAERIEAIAPGFVQELQTSEAPSPEKVKRFWELIEQTRSGRHPLPPKRNNPSRFENETPAKVAAMIRRLVETQGEWDWREDAAKVRGPVLFLFGTEDYLSLEAAQEWSEFLPNGRVFKMKGVGHFPAQEKPEEFRQVVEKFLGGEWPEGGTLPE